MCSCIECIGDQPEPTQDEIDAARYRWLREQRTARTLIDGGFRTSWEFRRFIEPNELDAAIDAAMIKAPNYK